MKNTTTTFNISQAFGSFWKLPDKANRIMYIGGATIGLALASFVFNFIMIIPLVGWIVGGLGLFLVVVASLFVYFYLFGLRYELAEAVALGKSLEVEPVLDRYAIRFRIGAKFAIASVLYYIPLIIVYMVLFGMLMASIALLSDGSRGAAEVTSQVLGVGLIVVFIVSVFVLVFVQLVYQGALELALTRQYFQEQSFGSLLQVGEVWETVQRNFTRILLYSVLSYALQIGFGVVILVCYVLIFVCIGIIALPVAYAAYAAYSLHFKAEMMGQFIALTKTFRD